MTVCLNFSSQSNSRKIRLHNKKTGQYKYLNFFSNNEEIWFFYILKLYAKKIYKVK